MGTDMTGEGGTDRKKESGHRQESGDREDRDRTGQDGHRTGLEMWDRAVKAFL